jgi:phosphatidylinositol alpha-mannosyltransferase
LKIGFVLDDSLDSSDGVQQYVLTMGRWLAAHGQAVHYLVGQTKRQDVGPVHSLSRNLAVRFNGNRMTIPLPAQKAAIKQLLEREQFDILHVQMPYSPFMAARVIKAAPRQTTIVGTFHIMPLGRLHSAGAKALQLALRSSAGRISQVWSVSSAAMHFAASLGITSTVLPNAVDLAQFKTDQRPSKKAFTVAFLGRLVDRKGCLQLLKAVDIVNRQKIDGLRVKIGGIGPQLAKLQKYVQSHSLADVVEFVGYLDEADKPAFLASADVAVFPSLGGESFGIVLLEAMAAGAGVVLAGNNAGYASVMGTDAPSLFDPSQPEELAELIRRVYQRPQMSHQLHKQQQELVKHYDVNLIAKKLLLYYQECYYQELHHQKAKQEKEL